LGKFFRLNQVTILKIAKAKVGGKKKHNKPQTAAIYRKNKLVAKNQLSVADQLPLLRPPSPKTDDGFLPARIIPLAPSQAHSIRSFWPFPSLSLSWTLPIFVSPAFNKRQTDSNSRGFNFFFYAALDFFAQALHLRCLAPRCTVG